METMRSQLESDMAESKTQSEHKLDETQLRALAGVKKSQLLEDIATSMSSPNSLEEEI